MQFLDSCCNIPAFCFRNNNKEKAWSKFHSAMTNKENTCRLIDLVGSQTSHWLALAVFEDMLSIAFKKPVCEGAVVSDVTISLSDEEKDISKFIGGAVLQKIKQKAQRLKSKEEQQEILEAVDSLSADSDEPGSMTSMLDRGGLMKLHPDIKPLFVGLEITFRTLFCGFSNPKLSFEAFLMNACYWMQFQHSMTYFIQLKQPKKTFSEISHFCILRSEHIINARHILMISIDAHNEKKNRRV
jgi:hypothetical protein